MLGFVFIIGVILYCLLYWLWATAQAAPQSTAAFINLVSNMLFVPEDTIFMIFRGILLCILFYIVANLLYTGLRGAVRPRDAKTSHS